MQVYRITLCTRERGCDRERASGTKAEWLRAAGVSSNRWPEGTPAVSPTHYLLKCSVRDTRSGRSRARLSARPLAERAGASGKAMLNSMSRASILQSLTIEGNDGYPLSTAQKKPPSLSSVLCVVSRYCNQPGCSWKYISSPLTAARNCAEWFFRHITSRRVFFSFLPFFSFSRGLLISMKIPDRSPMEYSSVRSVRRRNQTRRRRR